MSDPLAGLPSAARDRLRQARERHTWTSDLSVDEFAAVRAVGFEPVGQVMGSAVYNTAVYRWADCGYRRSFWGTGQGARTVTSASGGSGYAAFVRGRYEARRAAMGRLAAECAALGGDGVVGVHLTMAPFPTVAGTLEFQAIGTAVRADGPHRPPRPFLSDVTGQDFAKLIGAGYVPVDLALGISIGIRHDDYGVRNQTSWFAGNQEIGGWTELLSVTRSDARRNFYRDAAHLGGDGVLVSDIDLNLTEHECRYSSDNNKLTDHIVETTFVGTSVVGFGRSRHTAPKTLSIMRLNPHSRRRDARTTRRIRP